MMSIGLHGRIAGRRARGRWRGSSTMSWPAACVDRPRIDIARHWIASIPMEAAHDHRRSSCWPK
jgi:hypothetical protein